jgi:hypothetical protein
MPEYRFIGLYLFRFFFPNKSQKLSKNMLEMGSKSKKQLGLINLQKNTSKNTFDEKHAGVLIYGQWEETNEELQIIFLYGLL